MTISFDRTPIASQPVSVIIPTAAGQDPAAVIGGLRDQLKGRTHEFLVAAYGGKPAIANGNDVHLVGGDGYGNALATSFKAAQHPLIFSCPATWGECGVDLAKFLELIDQVDVVAGYRPGRSWTIRWAEGGTARLWFGLGVADVRCPVRLYRKSLLDRIAIQSRGEFAEVEVLAKANFLNALMSEVELDEGMPVAKDASWSSDFRQVRRKPEFTSGSRA